LTVVRQRRAGALTCADSVLDTDDTFRLPVQVWTRAVGALPEASLRIEVVAQLPAGLDGHACRQRVEDGELTLLFVVPRGLGPTDWGGTAAERNQVRRRFLILGRPLDQTRVFDVRAAVAAASSRRRHGGGVELSGRGRLGELALFAAILEGKGITRVEVHDLPQQRDQHLCLLGIGRVVADADLRLLLPSTVLELR
jgi:hypothetical protein